MKISKKNFSTNMASSIFDFVNAAIMLAVIFITFYPVLYILFASLSDGIRIIGHSGMLWHPLGLSWEGYAVVLRDKMVLGGYVNTIFVVFVGGSISMAITALAAYALSRPEFMHRRTASLVIIFTMYFSGGMIPFYFTVRDLGMYNSLWALVLPSAVNTFNLIIMRSGFEGTPEGIIESAKIDGANHFRIFGSILIPLVKPVMAVIALYYMVDKWNAWFHALMFIQDRAKYPLQLVLRGLLIANDATAGAGGDLEAINESVKYSTIVVATLPILLIYPFMQKYFVKGVIVGAVKG